MSQQEDSEVLDELFGASEADSDSNFSPADKAMDVLNEKDENNSSNSPNYFEEDDLDDDSKEHLKKSSKAKKKNEEELEDSAGVDGKLGGILKLFYHLVLVDKILEARRDFEEALSKLKGGRRKKDMDSDSVVKLHEY